MTNRCAVVKRMTSDFDGAAIASKMSLSGKED